MFSVPFTAASLCFRWSATSLAISDGGGGMLPFCLSCVPSAGLRLGPHSLLSSCLSRSLNSWESVPSNAMMRLLFSSLNVPPKASSIKFSLSPTANGLIEGVDVLTGSASTISVVLSSAHELGAVELIFWS